jgi:hypothetical protein
MADNPFEIPQTLRDASEQNLKHAHAAYEQLMAFVTRAMGAWMGAPPSNPMAAVFKDVQDHAMQIAMENAESAFTFAGKISNARTPQDIVTRVAGFKDVQDRAVAMVKKNAESGFALVEKVAKAQNFQEIVTLQTRFAQDQMQAYATEMQALQRLMGETLQKLQRG